MLTHGEASNLLLHTDGPSPVDQSHKVDSEARPRQRTPLVQRRVVVRVELLQTRGPLGDMARSRRCEVLNSSFVLLPVLLLGLFIELQHHPSSTRLIGQSRHAGLFDKYVIQMLASVPVFSKDTRVDSQFALCLLLSLCRRL